MNETKELERQLRSWKPRRPSAKLERRIFGGASPASGLWALQRALLPVAACLVLTMAMLHQTERSGLVGGASQLDLAALSNQSYAAYLPGSFACEANRLDTFGWTNTGASPSFPLSISPGKTNH